MNHIQRSLRLQSTGTASPVDFAAPGVGHYNCLEALACDSDATALVTVESPAGTVIWQGQIQANTGIEKTWPKDDPLLGAENQVMRVKVSTGNVHISANGFVTP